MKTIVIVQARMTSTRLPGKVLKEVLGKPLLEYQIERLRRIHNTDEIIVATTTNETDQPIVSLCHRLSVPYFRGSEEDVLSRYHGAALAAGARVVVRITADCPLIDPQVCGDAIGFYHQHRHQYDYVRLEHYPRGLDAEIFPFDVLDECWREATARPDREHVTPFIYNHPERYRVKRLYAPADYRQYRWTVDTPEDFELIRRLIEELYPAKPAFAMTDILAVLARHPDWLAINAAVRQRAYGE